MKLIMTADIVLLIIGASLSLALAFISFRIYQKSSEIKMRFKYAELIKEIVSKDGKLHFRRWQLVKTPWFSIWLHGIYAADEDKHLHNHPWDFKSIVLKGSYVEETESGFITQKPFKFNSRKGNSFHKIHKLLTPVVYTLFIATKQKRKWGYLVDGRFIENDSYRKLKHEGKLIK